VSVAQLAKEKPLSDGVNPLDTRFGIERITFKRLRLGARTMDGRRAVVFFVARTETVRGLETTSLRVNTGDCDSACAEWGTATNKEIAATALARNVREAFIFGR
jgi:hypothetical protein